MPRDGRTARRGDPTRSGNPAKPGKRKPVDRAVADVGVDVDVDVDVEDDVDGPERLDRLVPLARAALAPKAGGLGRAKRRGRRADAEPLDEVALANLSALRPVLVVRPGAVAKQISLSRPKLEQLLRAALAVGDHPSVVWVRGDSELAVHTAGLRVALARGLLVVGVRVECDQTGPAEVTVPFALGSRELAAGMVMATPARPDGPALLVEQWGAVVAAAVYRAVLDVATAAAATVGLDRDRKPLLPGAVSTDGKVLTIIPQARHAIDRQQLL